MHRPPQLRGGLVQSNAQIDLGALLRGAWGRRRLSRGLSARRVAGGSAGGGSIGPGPQPLAVELLQCRGRSLTGGEVLVLTGPRGALGSLGPALDRSECLRSSERPRAARVLGRRHLRYRARLRRRSGSGADSLPEPWARLRPCPRRARFTGAGRDCLRRCRLGPSGFLLAYDSWCSRRRSQSRVVSSSLGLPGRNSSLSRLPTAEHHQDHRRPSEGAHPAAPARTFR